MEKTKESIKRIKALISSLSADLDKTCRGNRAAAQRSRVKSIILTKEFKEFRKISTDELGRN